MGIQILYQMMNLHLTRYEKDCLAPVVGCLLLILFTLQSCNNEIELVFDDSEWLSHNQRENTKCSNMTKMALMFIFFWQTTFRVSDTGINILLLFFSTFLLALSGLLRLGALKSIAIEFPKTVSAGRRLLGTDADMFARWACCPSCSSIYPVNECKVKLANGEFTTKKCSFVLFPHHP